MEIVLATEVRTYTLSTLSHLLVVQQVAGLRRTVAPSEPVLPTEEPDADL